MKKTSVITMVSVLCMGLVGTSLAEGGVKLSHIGLHGAYSIGGDVYDSEIGFGGQAELALLPFLSLDFAVSRFSDTPDPLLKRGIGRSSVRELYDMTTTTMGLSAVLHTQLAGPLRGYALAGVNFNRVDIDVEVKPLRADAVWLTHRIEMDIDDQIGYHLGLGLRLPVHDRIGIFAEYRYTFLDLEGEATTIPTGETADIMPFTTTRDYKEDYSFGLVKMGVNILF